jgi:hypothetical protein
MHGIIDNCDQKRGFVWCHWAFKGVGHLTLFYFDIAARRQVFFDPSLWVHNRVGEQLRTSFGTTHFWETEQTGVTCEVVDRERIGIIGASLQVLFEPRSASANPNFKGSCASVCLVVLVCCQRFGCADVQRVCNAIRDAISRRNYGQTEHDQFLLSVYRWHERLTWIPGQPCAGNNRRGRRFLLVSHTPWPTHPAGRAPATGRTPQTVPATTARRDTVHTPRVFGLGRAQADGRTRTTRPPVNV